LTLVPGQLQNGATIVLGLQDYAAIAHR